MTARPARAGQRTPTGCAGGERTPTGLRSDAWLRGDDEVALANRVALASAGLDVSADGGRPVIGIANSASDLNPCNLPLRELAVAVRTGGPARPAGCRSSSARSRSART